MPSRKSNVDFAGESFGFELPGISEDGEVQTESVLARYFPELSLSFSAKGKRGGRLGRGDTAQVTKQATMKPLPEAPTFNITQTASPTMTASPMVNVGDEAIKNATTSIKPSLAYGESAEYFGHEDYWKNLERGFTPQQIQRYLEETPSVLRGANVKGGGGLLDQISKGQVPIMSGAAPKPAPAPGPTSAPTQTQAPKSFSLAYGDDPSYFGHEDVREAMKQGATTNEILDFINRRGATNIMRGKNVPGGGGLYDQLKAGTFK